jgi:hypothetical protein
MARRPLIALWAGLALGCARKPDGQPCQRASECESRICELGACAGSLCSCPGRDCGPCAPGWSCVHLDHGALARAIERMAGTGPGENRCQPRCGHCPPNYDCDPRSQICIEDRSYHLPTLTIDAPPADHGWVKVRSGERVRFHAAVRSRIGARIERVRWTFAPTFGPKAAEASAQGAEVFFLFPAEPRQWNVDVEVLDEHQAQARSHLAVIVSPQGG